MSWHLGYYYRSVRRGGRPRRQYVGRGVGAELAALLDSLARERKQAEAAARRAERERLEAIDRPVEELDRLADLAARAALAAAGYRQHKRGEWRRRRECDAIRQPGEHGG